MCARRGKGWEAVTEAAIRALVARGGPLVAILWGRDAANLKACCSFDSHDHVRAPPARSRRTTDSSARVRSVANELLVAQGAEPVDWRLG